MKWFSAWWYKYLFSEINGSISWFSTIWCRLRNHPAGVIWYTSEWEPDMHCKNCGDNLG